VGVEIMHIQYTLNLSYTRHHTSICLHLRESMYTLCSEKSPLLFSCITLAVLAYKCLHGTAPSYLADELLQSADSETRTRLRSASTSSLSVRRTRLSTVGERAFPVAATRTWNDLPRHVTSAPSLPVFCSRLKTHLFRRSFP